MTMLPEGILEACQPLVQDRQLHDEERADRLEQLLSNEPFSLKGKALESIALKVLWHWKAITDSQVCTTSSSNAPDTYQENRSTRTRSDVLLARPADGAPGCATHHHSEYKPDDSLAQHSEEDTASIPTWSNCSTPLDSTSIGSSTRNSFFDDTSGYSSRYHQTVERTIWDIDLNQPSTFDPHIRDHWKEIDSLSDFAPMLCDLSVKNPRNILRYTFRHDVRDYQMDQFLQMNGYDLGQTCDPTVRMLNGLDANLRTPWFGTVFGSSGGSAKTKKRRLCRKREAFRRRMQDIAEI